VSALPKAQQLYSAGGQRGARLVCVVCVCRLG
jgi:hypothetical protein